MRTREKRRRGSGQRRGKRAYAKARRPQQCLGWGICKKNGTAHRATGIITHEPKHSFSMTGISRMHAPARLYR